MVVEVAGWGGGGRVGFDGIHVMNGASLTGFGILLEANEAKETLGVLIGDDDDGFEHSLALALWVHHLLFTIRPGMWGKLRETLKSLWVVCSRRE